MNEIVEELNLRIETLEEQRNRALTDGVIATAKLKLALQKLGELQNENARLRTATVAALDAAKPALVA